MTYIYWLHLEEHTDIFSEGYIGITKNISKRIGEYSRILNNKAKKSYHITKAISTYGWDNIKVDILYRDLSLESALEKEKELRPNPNIGWNTLIGGGNGGYHSNEVKNKISISMMGNKNTNGFSSCIVTCPYCNKQGQYASMMRWHFDNCKYL